ncbi:MAG: hypothetical protein IKC22_07200 [Bacilli bacterium]|nr:hypothetical protein [Bacilli bacterium]
MKKYIITLIIPILLLTTTGCNINGGKNDLVLPKTYEEVEALMLALPYCEYDIDDAINEEFEEEIPEGTHLALVAAMNKEFFIGVSFIDEESLEDGRESMIALIEEVIIYEFEQDVEDFTIYENDCWIYTGTSDFVSYFEGKNNDFVNPEEVFIPLVVIKSRLQAGAFEINIEDVEEDSIEYITYGARKIITAKNSADKELIVLYQVESTTSANKYRSQLIETLEDDYFSVLIDRLGFEINHYSYGTYENYVYVGTDLAISFLKNE